MVCVVMGGQRLRPLAQIMADFAKDRYRGGVGAGLLDLFDFVAAGSRTYINALGHLVTAGPNEPRNGHHAWDAAKGQYMPVGLLLEQDGADLLSYPIASIENWNNVSCTLTTENFNFMGVFGGVRCASAGDVWHRLRHDDIQVTAGETYTVTTYVRAGTSGQCRLTFRDETDQVESRVSGVFEALVGGDTNTAAGAVEIISETAVPGGVIVITRFTPNFTGPVAIGIGPNSNVPGEDIIVFACKPEIGSVATSFIFSDGVPLSRAKDVLEISALTIAKLLVKHNRAPEMIDFSNPDAFGTSWVFNPDGSMTYDGVGTGTPSQVRWNDIGVKTNGEHYLLGLEHTGGDLKSKLNGGVGDTRSEAGYDLYGDATADGVHFIGQVGHPVTITGFSVKPVTMPTRYGLDLQGDAVGNVPAHWSQSGYTYTRDQTSWSGLNLTGTGEKIASYEIRGRVKVLSGSGTITIHRRNETDTANIQIDTLLNGSTGAEADFGIVAETLTTGRGIWIDSNTMSFEVELYAVREVIQELTVHIEGLMSYVDSDQYGVIRFWRLRKDGNDQMGAWVDTVNGTGDLVFNQSFGGSAEYLGSSNTWSPGSDKAFNIASYHTNIAMGGAAAAGYTGNRSMTGLPDIVGEPMTFQYSGSSVTLSKFEILLGASGSDLVQELVA